MRLVLSVGKNPLPVALAGLFFRDAVTRVHFVPSAQTEEECGRIETLWKERGFTPPIKRTVIAAEPDSSTETKLLRELPEEGIHFHYSGGTAAMALAIIKARPRAETSYLSLHSNRILNDGGPLDEGDLRLDPVTRVSLEQLVHLHGYAICTQCESRPIVPLTDRLTRFTEKVDLWRVLSVRLRNESPGYFSGK